MNRIRRPFFFQAEDGIRGFHVTGVQTCALPIFVRTDPEAIALGDPRAVLRALGVGGFERRDATTKTFRVRFPDVTELLAFAASYGWYERELREMPTESRQAFDADLAARLEPLTTSAGIEDTWTLNLFVARSEENGPNETLNKPRLIENVAWRPSRSSREWTPTRCTTPGSSRSTRSAE